MEEVVAVPAKAVMVRRPSTTEVTMGVELTVNDVAKLPIAAMTMEGRSTRVARVSARDEVVHLETTTAMTMEWAVRVVVDNVVVEVLVATVVVAMVAVVAVEAATAVLLTTKTEAISSTCENHLNFN